MSASACRCVWCRERSAGTARESLPLLVLIRLMPYHEFACWAWLLDARKEIFHLRVTATSYERIVGIRETIRQCFVRYFTCASTDAMIDTIVARHVVVWGRAE